MRARGGHLNWHAKHANMVTGGHKEGKKEGKKRGQKRGHNMLYTRVTSTKSLPPSSHPTKNPIDLKTQDKTPKKWRVMLTARQTMSDWDKLHWQEVHFPKNFHFQNLQELRDADLLQNGWIFKKIPNGLWLPPLNSKFCDENHEHHHQECDLCSIASFGTCWWSFMTRAA